MEKEDGVTSQRLGKGQGELWKGLEVTITECCSEERELVRRINLCKCQKLFKDHFTEECVREREREHRDPL